MKNFSSVLLRNSFRNAKSWGNKNLMALLISHCMWALTCSMPFNVYTNHPWTLPEYFAILSIGLVIVMPTSFFMAQNLIEYRRLFLKGMEVNTILDGRKISKTLLVYIFILTIFLFSVAVVWGVNAMMMLAFGISGVIAVVATITGSITISLLSIYDSLSSR